MPTENWKQPSWLIKTFSAVKMISSDKKNDDKRFRELKLKGAF